MKKYFITITLGVLLGMATVCFAGDGDISSVEVREDVASWQIDTVKLLRFTETAIVTYRKADSVGNNLGETFDVVFSNQADDPLTPENEEITDFTDFYNYLHTRIRAMDSLKTAIQKAVSIKLGL